MSRHLQSLKQDDRVEMMGPLGDDKLRYQVTPSGLAAFRVARCSESTLFILL